MPLRNTDTPPNSKTAHIQEIDVLRGLAALTVVFSHYFPYWNRYNGEIPVLVTNAVGSDAVKLFFAISGFVIFVTLERCRTVADFAVLRFSRLYPAYWASLVTVTLVSVLVFGEQFWPTGFVVNLTMFQEFLGVGHLDGVYWSLSVEMAFYLNVAWVFALGLHRRVFAVVGTWLLLSAAWVLTTRGFGSAIAPEAVGADERGWLALLFAFDKAPYFALGILFYHVRRRGWTAAAAVLMAGAVGVEFLLESWRGITVAAVVLVLFGLALGGYLRRLVGGITLWLGTISYSLYLVHRNLGYQLLAELHARGFSAVTGIGIAVACALALATALTFLAEKPALAAIRAKYAPWRRPPVVAATNRESARTANTETHFPR